MNPRELKRLLERAQISQTELARRVGVTPEAVCQWLSGKRKMHDVFAGVVRKVLETAVGVLEELEEKTKQ